MQQHQGDVPDGLIVTLRLAAVAGIRRLRRSAGVPDFSAVHVCRAVVELHRAGTVQCLQRPLRDDVALFGDLMGLPLPFSPICMLEIGDKQDAIAADENMIEDGCFASVVFFPSARRGAAQLRVCVAANHTPNDIRVLAATLKRVQAIYARSGSPGRAE